MKENANDYLPLKQVILLLSLFLFLNTIQAQKATSFSVSGKITSTENQLPVAGVSIIEKGTRNGTSSDKNGLFSISVSRNAVLVITNAGFKEKEVRVAENLTLEIELEPSAQQLTDVVVIGYGTQKKKDLTGSIVNLTQKDLTLGPSSSFDQMLQGKVAGAQITQTSGAPGGNVNVIIRGISSITGGNSPLYVIDGYAIGTGGGGSDLSTYSSNTYTAAGIVSSSAVNRVNPLT